ncbi:hypothetical protein PIB30_058084 [Stylosanthes scabra]|uniref:Histidinol dehydrogenase n=1 Tax=Stylosanthes scabra TaxID=79078 RepID=A0ABU6TJN9_9FABA|nr:hypothetical protein [Stylosanthes scabra]
MKPAHISGMQNYCFCNSSISGGTICKAIAAMAWGTEICPKLDFLTAAWFIRVSIQIIVEKIFGPGNQYVTAEKMILQNNEAMVAIDMPAGPSEVLVIADKHAIPRHAEHGPDSQVVLVIAGEGVNVNVTEEELSKQC